MELTILKIPGAKAVGTLQDYRKRYPETGEYPFLIRDAEDLVRIQETAELNEQDAASIIQASLKIQTADWIRERRKEAEEYAFSADETLGKWPGEILEKGAIGLHMDILTGKIKPEVILGLAKIERPWHLPAILKYGNWNDCPFPDVHCAFHREWQDRFGAEIIGMSADVVECIVENPPRDQKEAIALAWQQYWYCTDIVEQGCGSVSNLAATLLNSPYWFFWWD